MNALKVPSLRFPEFSGEWEEKKFGDVVSLSSSKHNSEKNKSVQKCIELEHIDQVTGRLLGFVEGSNFGSIKNKFNKNNVLFGKLRPYLRKYIKAPFDGVCSSEIWVLDGKLVSNDYLYYLVQLEKFIELADQSIGSKMPRADWSHVSSGIFLIPSLPEQTKIAAFLSAVDTKIDQLSQKKTLLEQYKKGIMQKIFSQQIRFKSDDGGDYPEWEEKKLGDVASKNMQKNKGSTISYVLTNSASQGIVSQQDYFDKDIANQNNLENYYVVDVDDFVYNPRISVHAPVGPIKRNKLTKGVMSPLYTVFSFTKDSVMLAFIEMYFSTNCWHDYMLSISNFGARHDRMNISAHDFFEMPIFFPCLEEQTKIANFLTAIDSKIEQVAQQLEAAKQFKKGLLQQMFV